MNCVSMNTKEVFFGVFPFQSVVCTLVEFAQATPLPFPVCLTTLGSQIDKWTMDHMETREAICQEQCLKIYDIFRNSQYFAKPIVLSHFLNKPFKYSKNIF